MMEVVEKELINLLNIGLIYPILDSKGVSSIQVIPKKSKFTVAKNENKDLVPTQIRLQKD